MKHWSNQDIKSRDLLDGEAVFDKQHPSPAYEGTKFSSTTDLLYEVEIVPGSDRTEEIIDPDTFQTVTDTVIDILYRQWNDEHQQWVEVRMPSLLRAWGYKTIPINMQAKKLSQFDKAMKGI